MDVSERKEMKIVPIVSGGMDSITMLYHLRAQGHELFPLSVNYGQRHAIELAAAAHICIDILGLHHEIADLRGITRLISNSSQTGGKEVPEGHYAEDNMKATVVPNRNMIMLAVAVGYAINISADAVAYGAHAGDHAIYPDCRKEFVDALVPAIALADWHQVELISPFVGVTKAEIAKLGLSLGVPFEKTHTCYKGKNPACGKCSTCIERREAFYLIGAEDPLPYEVTLRESFDTANMDYLK